MKCIKCGCEYDGDICPNCNGPKIIVNDNDYLQRRKEWEEKQAKKAASPKDSEEPFEDSLVKLVKNTTVKVASKAANVSKREKNKSTVIPWIRKHWKLIIILVVLIIAMVGASSWLYDIYTRQNRTLYILSDGRIYDISKLENELICDESSAIFTVSNDSFYTPAIPDSINKNNIIQSMSSDDGRYFATVEYDSTQLQYSLYVWNEEQCQLVSKSSKRKDIEYISDKGKVLYTDTEYLYEDAVSSIALCYYDIPSKSDEQGRVTTVNANIRSVYLYLKNNRLVYLTSDNNLYSYDYSGSSDKAENLLVAENVKDMYGMSADTDDFYSNSSQVVKNKDVNVSIIYYQNNEYYYSNLVDDATYLFKSVLSGVEIVYEKKNGYVYCINIGSISMATITDSGSSELSVVDDINSSTSVVYFPGNDTLVYINKSGALASINKGNTSSIRENVSSGSLSIVDNTNNGITYIANGIQYYRSSLNADEIIVQEIPNGTSTDGMLEYKNNLYYINADSELYSCTLKGNSSNKMGEVTRFWLD